MFFLISSPGTTPPHKSRIFSFVFRNQNVKKKKGTPLQFLTDIVLAKIIVKIGPPHALDKFQILGWTVPVDCYCAHS